VYTRLVVLARPPHFEKSQLLPILGNKYQTKPDVYFPTRYGELMHQQSAKKAWTAEEK
jgi:hypothetical protein